MQKALSSEKKDSGNKKPKAGLTSELNTANPKSVPASKPTSKPIGLNPFKHTLADSLSNLKKLVVPNSSDEFGIVEAAIVGAVVAILVGLVLSSAEEFLSDLVKSATDKTTGVVDDLLSSLGIKDKPVAVDAPAADGPVVADEPKMAKDKDATIKVAPAALSVPSVPNQSRPVPALQSQPAVAPPMAKAGAPVSSNRVPPPVTLASPKPASLPVPVANEQPSAKLFMPADPSIGIIIQEASRKVGVDPGYMMAMAAQESGFNPKAKAKTSSATGLFQFIDDTWVETVGKYGAQYGIRISDIKDPRANALMGALYLRDNIVAFTKATGSAPSYKDMYAMHFLGRTGGIKAAKIDQNSIAANVFPKAAKANKNIFYDDGKALTIAEFRNKLDEKVGSKALSYNLAIGNTPEVTVAAASDTGTSAKSIPTSAPVAVGSSLFAIAPVAISLPTAAGNVPAGGLKSPVAVSTAALVGSTGVDRKSTTPAVISVSALSAIKVSKSSSDPIVAPKIPDRVLSRKVEEPQAKPMIVANSTEGSGPSRSPSQSSETPMPFRTKTGQLAIAG